MERFRCEDFPWCRKQQATSTHPEGGGVKNQTQRDDPTDPSTHLQTRRTNRQAQSAAPEQSGNDRQPASGRPLCRNLGEMTTTSEGAILSATHWVWWVFSMLVIPLLRDHFYVTEREGSLQTVWRWFWS